MRALFARLIDTFRRRTLDRELEQEIATHLDLAAADMQARGMNAEAAQRAALRHFGGVARAQETDREVRGFAALDAVQAIARSVQRGFRRNPGTTVVVIVTLALGIGATTAVFSVVNGVLLKPLPFPEAARLVALYHRLPGFGSGDTGPQSPATYFTYRDQGRVFEDLGLWTTANVSVSRTGEPEEVQALRLTEGTLPLLGVHAHRGRLIQKEDDVDGAPNRVVLTHGYWQRSFGGTEDVIGQSLTINTAPYEIIGVLPASFRWLNTTPDVVLPLRLARTTTVGGNFGFRGVGRLKPGVTIAQANDDIARMIPLVTEQFPLDTGVTPEMWKSIGMTPNVRPLSEDVTGNLSRPLWILLGMAVIVLLIAWTNVANLLLVRAEARQGELAVRQALGADRRRIAGELLSESVTMGLAGGALGVVCAAVGVALLQRMAPTALPRAADIGIDVIVLLVTLTVSIVASLLFGLLPVLKFGAPNIAALKEAGRSTSDAPGRHRTRNALVVTQIALALVLLIVSGLMGRTFVAMRQVAPGYAGPAEVQTFSIALPVAVVRDPTRVTPIYEQIAERLTQVPGVATVGLANNLPMDASQVFGPVFVEDHPVEGAGPGRRVKSIGAGYLEAMGTPIVAGRTITWTDIRQLTPVALVSENFAREYWQEPTRALGKRIGGLPGKWYEIVGVAGNVREVGLNQPAPTVVFMPMANRDFMLRTMSYVVRSNRAGSPGFLRELQQAVWSVNPNVPLAKPRTLEEIQAASMSQTSFALVMLAVAACVALLLALVGVYSVVSYIAAGRTHEIGIRMALGAQGRDVRALLLRHGLSLSLVGVAVGIGAALLVTPVTSQLLYGVGPMDPLTYGAVAIALGAVTVLASYLPARRAARAQPLRSLRSTP